MSGNPIIISRPWPWPLERRLQAYFHEISHDFTIDILAERFHSFYGNKLLLYEAFAWLLTMYIDEQMGFTSIVLEGKKEGTRGLSEYNNDITTMLNQQHNPALLGMLIILKEEHGWDLFQNFFKIIQEKIVPPAKDLITQCTYLIYCLNASAKRI